MRLLRSNKRSKGISIHSKSNPTRSYFGPVTGGQVKVFHGASILTDFTGNLVVNGPQHLFGTPIGLVDNIWSSVAVVPDIPATATEWIERNTGRLTKYAGQYVAITNKGIVAVADDFEGIYAKSKKKGIMNPLVFKIPKANSRPKIVSARSR
jgi:hypothetical protein